MIFKNFGFPFFIARRYLLSKKSHKIINIISGISVLSVSIGTMALIIVLSVFNGFESLVVSLFNTFNPDLQVTVKEGKTFPMHAFPVAQVRKIPGLVYFTEVVEENALLKYKNRQSIISLKGVSDGYGRQTKLDSMIVSGTFRLEGDGQAFAIVGYGVAYNLDLRINDFLFPMEIYVPKRGLKSVVNPSEAFNTRTILASGVFSVQQEFDAKYVLVPLDFARQILDYSDEVTSLELGLSPGTDIPSVQKKISGILGEKYLVKDRFQQQELLYKIMKSEKLAIFLILAFILLVATFNVVGSLTMLILDKRKDIAVLWSLGTDHKTIRKIFMTEGIMISLVGAVSGLVFGALLCWLQQHYGFIRLGAEQGAFLVKYYPVKMKIPDFLIVFCTVFIIGFVATWLPVRRISKRQLEKRVFT